VYHGRGFTHADVYNLPTYLRRFYLKHLVDVRSAEQEQINKSANKNTTQIHKLSVSPGAKK
jgi:hypothetical protein